MPLKMDSWVAAVAVPDSIALGKFYPEAFNFGAGCRRYGAWGVFEHRGISLRQRFDEVMAARRLGRRRDLFARSLRHLARSLWTI